MLIFFCFRKRKLIATPSPPAPQRSSVAFGGLVLNDKKTDYCGECRVFFDLGEPVFEINVCLHKTHLVIVTCYLLTFKNMHFLGVK